MSAEGQGPRADISVQSDQEQREVPPSLLEKLEAAGHGAARLIRERYHGRVKLPGVVSVSLIDDTKIARVHGEFMNDPSPTDVITFPYGNEGEILISVETAERQALEFGTDWERELILYLVHGMLHLCGYDDITEVDRTEMERVQGAIMTEVCGDG